MNKLRLISYFALFIVFCAEYRCAPNESKPDVIQSIIDAASNVQPRGIMKVDILDISFENCGQIVKSYAHESLTLITNEHKVRWGGEPRVFHHFTIRLKNSDPRSEPVFTFWNVDIKSFVYFASTGSQIRLILIAEINKGIVTLDFLNPGDTQLFLHYAIKGRRRRKDHVIDVLKFEIFDRRTKRKIDESSFAVIHRERARNIMPTYTISLESDGVTQKPLLIFSSGRYSVTDLIEDRMALFVSDEPNLVFVLQFASFENDAAVAFHEDFRRRPNSLDSISDEELRTFINQVSSTSDHP